LQIFLLLSFFPTHTNIITKQHYANGFLLSNGYSRRIPETGKLLARIWRGESHFSQKWPLVNVGQSGEYSLKGLSNVSESGESSVNGLANVGESGEYSPNLLVKVGASVHDRFLHLFKPNKELN
jgi:hypothetical protein